MQTNKRKILITAVIILLLLGGLVFYAIQKSRKAQPQISPQEEMVKQQLEELDRLRQESGGQPATEEQIQGQLEELENLRKQAEKETQAPGAPTISQEEIIKKQLEELGKLRAQ